MAGCSYRDRDAAWHAAVGLVWLCLGAVAGLPARGAQCEDCALPAAGGSSADVDGVAWPTEVLHDAVKLQLKRLGQLLAQPESIPEHDLQALVEPGFACTALVPGDLEVVLDDPMFIVQRPRGAVADAPLRYHGATGLQRAARQLVGVLPAGAAIRSKFKVFRLEQDAGNAGHVTTRTKAQFFAAGSAGRGEINATWRCRWVVSEKGQGTAPRLVEIRVTDYEQVSAGGGGQPWLADCTRAVLGHNRSFDAQVRRDINHWMGCLDYRIGVDIQGHQGLAVGDIDGDGLEDVYLCQNGGLPNLLFVQQPNGTAVERSAQAGLDLLAGTRGVLLLDLDNDGDQDIVQSANRTVIFLENDGRAHFRLRAQWQSPSMLYSLSAADFDNDSDLDIYVCGLRGSGPHPNPVPYHDANNGGANALLVNSGAWKFRDATDEVGLGQNNSRFSYASSWEDYDNDGDQDLYVANDFGRNNLYRNQGGRFVDVAAAAAAQDVGAGMSVSWGDCNNDGHMDLYISNMFSSAGGRIAFQQRFGSAYSAEEKKIFQRHARGNTLLVNQGDGTFHDASQEANITLGRWAWASSFVDLNNDGREDVLVANGFVTGDDTKDL